MGDAAQRTRISDIDVFRGIAALVVAALHTREVMWVGLRESWNLHGGRHASPDALLGYLTFPLLWGSIGVPIFFVLSGYCIHRRQALARIRTGTFQLSTANYLLRRFVRIYPVFVGALLLTLLCDSVSRHFDPNNPRLGDTGIGAFVANILAIQGITSLSFGTDGPLWTLSVEVQFYVLYPLLLIVMRRFGIMRTLLILMALNIASYFTFQRHGDPLFPSFYVSWYLGVLVAEGEAWGIAPKLIASTERRAILFGLSLVIMCCGCALLFLSAYGAFQVWAVAFAVFLIAQLARPVALHGPVTRLFRWMGTFSYSIYVVHLPLVVLLSALVFHSVRQISLAPFCAALLVAVGCAYGFSFIFERPALVLSQKLKEPPQSFAVSLAQ
jgi:peptidoglycan/LPS O-acetylase OafA/YrhL